MSEQKRREVVDRKGSLNTVRGKLPPCECSPGVIDQDVDTGQVVVKLSRKIPNGRLQGEVRDKETAASCRAETVLKTVTSIY